MAFGGNGSGFDREDLHAPMAEINTTPLVDVMLVLLVIFLVTAPMLTHSIKMELPNETASEIKDQKPITISIDLSSQYYWNEEKIEIGTLETRLREAAANNLKQPVHIRADTNVSYGKVSHLLALCQRSGLTNVGFVTEPEQ